MNEINASRASQPVSSNLNDQNLKDQGPKNLNAWCGVNLKNSISEWLSRTVRDKDLGWTRLWEGGGRGRERREEGGGRRLQRGARERGLGEEGGAR
eukprot:3558824-Rhodomonas_salina.2